jgi:two-component system chemotaxis response regulator CheB
MIRGLQGMSDTGLTARRNIILIGASAGGVEAMLHLVENLPPRIEAAIFFIMHRPSNGESHLAVILSRRTKMEHLSDGGKFGSS